MAIQKCPICGRQMDFVRRGFIQRFKKLSERQKATSIAASKKWLKLMEKIRKGEVDC